MKTLRLRFKQFSQLSSAERIILLAALILLPLTAAGLRIFGFKRCCKVLNRISPRLLSHSAEPQITLQRARSIARAVDAAANHGPYQARCLVRSMTLQVVLRALGIESDLIIGVRRAESHFEAHAWLQVESHFLDSNGKKFAQFKPLRL